MRRVSASLPFSDITRGANLWWGNKMSARLHNLGLVIGLKSEAAHVGWRLDYDDTKRMHLNQHVYQDAEPKLYHPIVMPNLGDAEGFVFNTWVRWTKLNDTKVPTSIRERMGTGSIKDYRSLHWGS